MEERTCPACGINQKRNWSNEAWRHVNNNSVECDPSLLLNPVEFPIHPPRMDGTDITRDIDSK
jgi:hypothetical protein